MIYAESDVTDNMGLVFHTARRRTNLMNSGVMEFQDLISEGTLGLIHALERFDASKGFQFSTYACRCISGYMFRGHRSLHMEQWKAKASRLEVLSKTISMYQPFSDGDGVREVVGLNDHGKSARKIFEGTHRHQVWEKLLPILTPRRREIIEMYLEGTSQIQIAAQLGVKRQFVHQTIKHVICLSKKLFAVKESNPC